MASEQPPRVAGGAAGASTESLRVTLFNPRANRQALALFGSLISLYYYLIVLKVIFQTEGAEARSLSSPAQNGLSKLTIVLAAAIVLFLGIAPQFLVARIIAALQ